MRADVRRTPFISSSTQVPEQGFRKEEGMALHRQGRHWKVAVAVVVATVVVGGSLSAATPVHHWAAEGNANDSVGTNHGALLGNATFATGQSGQAFSLDGNDDRVEFPESTTHYFTGSFGVEAWAKTSTTTNQDVVMKYDCGIQ